MVGAISGVNSYYNVYSAYGMLQRTARAQNAQNPETARAVQGGTRASVWTARQSASPEAPVQPANGEEARPARSGPVLREGADPAEMAVRMRIRPYEETAAQGAEKSMEGNDGGELRVGAEGAQAAVEEGKCQTCEKRKYQDGSDDMGVSFQTPTRVAPEMAASAVRGHENEHVVRERAKAEMEDRRVVSQSVTLHTDICPECGKVYISGGTTRTVTAANKEEPAQEQTRQEQERQGLDLLV